MKIQNIQNIFNIYKTSKTQNPFAPHWQAKERLSQDVFQRQEIAFKGKRCPTSNFEVRYLYDIDCPCCAQKMVTSNQLNSFVKNVEHKNGEDLIKILKRYEKYYHQTEKEVVELICKQAVNDPKSNISKIIKDLALEHQENLSLEQTKILEELKNRSNSLENNEKEKYVNFIDKSIETSKCFDDENYFKRKKFLDDLYALGKDFKNQRNFEQIYEHACKLPTSSDSVNAFLIKYSRRGDEEIARRLLSPSLATTEHVQPRSLNGENNTANYIAMCADCNSKRGNTSYVEWFKTHPEMPKNLQKYVNSIAERIKTKELRGYNSYLYEIIETIERETDGTLQLEAPDMDAIKVSDASIELGKIKKQKNKKPYFERLEKIIEDKKSTLEELRKIAKLFKKDEEFQTLQRYYALIAEIETLVAKKRSISDDLQEAKKEQKINDTRIKSLEKAEEQIENPNIEQKEASELRMRIRALKEKIQPVEIPASKIQALDEDYKRITQEIAEKRDLLAQITSTLTLEDEYKEIEDELVAKLEERNSIRQKIHAYTKEIEDKDEVLQRRKEIEKEHSIRKAFVSTPVNKEVPTSAETKLLKEYELLCKKLEIIDNIDPKTFCANLKQPKGLKYTFILQEAKNSIQIQIDALKEEEIIQIQINKEIIEELEKERKACNLRLKEIAEIENTITELQTELVQLNLIQSEDEINEKLDLIKTRHLNLKEKIKYLDIDQRISDAIQMIKELEEELKKKHS